MKRQGRASDIPGSVRLSGHLLCATTAEADIVRHHLPAHVALTLAEAGCLSFDVEQTENPLIWRVEECFLDRAAFVAHQARTRASVWGVATAAIRRDYQVSEADPDRRTVSGR